MQTIWVFIFIKIKLFLFCKLFDYIIYTCFRHPLSPESIRDVVALHILHKKSRKPCFEKQDLRLKN
jgi:hypothetical protein